MKSQDPDRLNSWKAIANYLGRSERTARRWEMEENLPIHRQPHRSLASVYAFRSEIDAWRDARDAKPQIKPAIPERSSPADSECAIVVLPFAFVGPDPGESYLADGFTYEVIAELSRIRSLRVISQTSSMTLKGTQLDARSLGAELGVSHLLEGAVRRQAAGVRVNVSLIDAGADQLVWSESYSGDVQDVFDIQEHIARETTAALKLRLTREDSQRLSERPVGSWSAWQAIVRARQEAMRWNRAGIDNAVQLLQAGLAAGGDDPRLHAALGRAHLQYREAGFDLSSTPLEQAEYHVSRVFETEPDSAAGHQLSGWLHYARGEIQQAVDALKKALEVEWADPDPLGLLCNCYLIAGQMSAARTLISQLLSIDPLTFPFRLLPAWADVLEGKHVDAVATYQEMLEREPDSAMARLFLIWILAVNDRTDEAADIAEGFSESDRALLPAQIGGQFAAACRGKPLADAVDEQNRSLAAANDLFPRMIAQAYALGGDADRALEWLSVAVDRGFTNFPYLDRHDPILTQLKHDDRYVALTQEVRRRWEAFRA